MKSILLFSGFDNIESFENINNESVDGIEKYFNENLESGREILPKCHAAYQSDKLFRLLPAHRATILNIPKIISDIGTDIKQHQKQQIDECETNPAFSNVLKEFIKSALNNYGNPSPRNRYSNVLINLSIYTLIMGGKALYEALSANLPIPAPVTVCQCIFTEFFISQIIKYTGKMDFLSHLSYF